MYPLLAKGLYWCWDCVAITRKGYCQAG